MKMLVIKGFEDKETKAFHFPGKVLEIPEARAKEIEKRGFGQIIDEPKQAKEAEPKKAKPKAEAKKKK